MRQVNIRGASVEMLQAEMGTALGEYIDLWGDKSDFAREAGSNRATLYRLLSGKNAGAVVKDVRDSS
jgi:DNA-binding phage protein